MFDKFKSTFYFPIASYFRFFATIRLRKWKPQIIVVTGSNGKTTLLHMLESQLGENAKISHHANSSFGIPFDILDIHRKTLRTSEWLSMFLSAPLNIFKPLPKQNIYVVEADADRPHEGKFLAELLKPDVVLWVSTARTHSMNFDHLVSEGKFKTVEEAIAYEYGYFLELCKNLVIIDGDSTLETAQVARTKASIQSLAEKELLRKYAVQKEGTLFEMVDQVYSFKGLLPKEIFLSIAMCKAVVEYLKQPFDTKFSNFQLPPGRGSFFAGIQDTLLIDSTYNGNLTSNKAVLTMFAHFPAEKKWVVIGDMKELGKEEQEEHEALANVLNAMDLVQVVVVGKIIKQYTLPLLRKEFQPVGFDSAPEAAKYIVEHIQGKETILFKGSQSIYLEGIVEMLLRDKNDASKLPRQEAFWKLQRQSVGF